MYPAVPGSVPWIAWVPTMPLPDHHSFRKLLAGFAIPTDAQVVLRQPAAAQQAFPFRFRDRTPVNELLLRLRLALQ